MRNKGFISAPDLEVARLAQLDHGVLTTPELLDCGLTRHGIHRRVRTGRLHRIHRGIYAVGHAAVSREGRWLAAVKACGAGAVLSHQGAAALWELLPRYGGATHVTVPAARNPCPSSRGITVHRSRTLGHHDTVRLNRIPVTTPARTLRDLRRMVPRGQWEAALDRARVKGLDIGDVVDEPPTRSVLERRFLRVCHRYRIPAPRVNARVGDFLVDFLWTERDLIVEVDGYEFHSGRASFESDRARDAQLVALGYRVLRFTYRQVTAEPARVAGTLRRLLL